MNPDTRTRIIVVVATTIVTVGIHYGWIIEPIFGHVPWLHAVHGRFCYIPIMIAASWFGLRGGLFFCAATMDSIAGRWGWSQAADDDVDDQGSHKGQGQVV
ncbi:MAG: hypothetical protein IH969_08920, partial [Candidatus Krumholzibacteriota bacterium]|nr:hypothetical protein [Candidatus Krumholzibacteriota bacterium]